MICRYGSPTFDGNVAPGANAGCFAILTGGDFRREDNIIIGLGKMNQSGNVVPAAIVGSLAYCDMLDIRLTL